MIRRRALTHLLAAAALAPTARALPASAGEAREARAAHLLGRLGFGPRPGELRAVAADPEAWVERQLAPAGLPLPPPLQARLADSPFATLNPIHAVRGYALAVRDSQRQQAAEGAAMSAPAATASMAPMGAAAPAADELARAAASPVGRYVRTLQLPALADRLWRALLSPRQLEEVMVDFWFNHFNVFQGKSWLRVLVGHYEHHAIRPHALGRFRDLLGATAHHPAMLYYLDNWQSAGGLAAAMGRGLNENYARELMELHTLGVDGGYSQQDVTQLARIFTGWTLQPLRLNDPHFEPPSSPPGVMPGFWFNPRMHEPGAKPWLGLVVAAGGEEEGERALDQLARHPATARHIARKLATWFVSDQPDPALVTRLARVFEAEDGQIVPVLRTLFGSEAFGGAEARGAKFKTPYHYTLSALRAGGWAPADPVPVAQQLATQGMPLYGCATPDGYASTEAAWLNPDAMAKRINLAALLAQARLGRPGEAPLQGGQDLAGLLDSLGPQVTPETRRLAERHAADPVLATTLVLAGPGMMRR